MKSVQSHSCFRLDKILLVLFCTAPLWAKETKPAQMPGMDNTSVMEKVTVQGEAKDRVPLERVTPPTDLLLKDAIPFTTQSEIEKILKVRTDPA